MTDSLLGSECCAPQSEELLVVLLKCPQLLTWKVRQNVACHLGWYSPKKVGIGEGAIPSTQATKCAAHLASTLA